MPTLGTTQAQCALQRANEIRFQRAAVRRILRERDTRQGALGTLVTTIETCEVAQCMKVSDLLTSCYGIGTTKAVAVLRKIHASDRRVLADLSERQRALLLETLRNGL